MNKAKKAQIGFILFIIGVIIVIITMVGITIDELVTFSYKKKYCIQEGYKFYDSKENKCYNLIPHETGIGDMRIYSGEINKFEVRLRC
ncbi:hypothetical protein LCGC14_0374910 [marine sediment metagenome]|uniref:Uncharacterized protein n=1 Tax=marine sediment metagenome TaxID=412755 RepID=A0A0F9VRJ6_9ZZZZ